MPSVFIKNNMAAGDILMLTAAVRDLKTSHQEYHIGVGTSYMEFWENNPYIDRNVTEDNAEKVIYADYPLYKQNNKLPYHFIHGFRKFLEDALEIRIEQGPFKVDLHLTDEEKDPRWTQRVIGNDKPFWIINTNWKPDITNKRWLPDRWQQVVNQIGPAVQWVQTGRSTQNSVDLSGVIDLRGITTPRQMIELMYHASGVLTPISFPMHLATMDTPSGNKRPCVVVAGGREPSTWEAYPTHQFLHNCGCFDCNKDGGCWKRWTKKDQIIQNLYACSDQIVDDPSNVCSHPVPIGDGDFVPLCMCYIRAEEVVGAIRKYLFGDFGK